MNVALIPVLKVFCPNQGIEPPKVYPYWENRQIWQEYIEKNYQKAGFKDTFITYSEGSGFCRAIEISENNLIKIINDHFEGTINGDWTEEETETLFGGYVLKIDDKDIFFPQCCGGLNDIVYWEAVTKYRTEVFFNGHPEPELEFVENHIVIRFSDKYEPFEPPTGVDAIKILLKDLEVAYENALQELKIFEEQIYKIKHFLNYTPVNDSLSTILIYRNRGVEIDEIRKKQGLYK